MTIEALSNIRFEYISKNWNYERCYYTDFNYLILKNCIYRKTKRYNKYSFNDITIMIDTETSKPDYSLDIDESRNVVTDILNTKFKWNQSYKEVAKKKEFQLMGINVSGTTRPDVYYEYLKDTYPWIFKEDAYSDIQAMQIIYDYVFNNPLKELTLDNHVVIWTLSIRLFNLNIATLYGRKPSELTDCIKRILEVLEGNKTFMYIFNMSYDYVFLRKFFNRDFGLPVKQLNVKPHYPVSIEYENGLILKDALILAQRKLSKWAEDLCVDHQKANGDWDYKKCRHQNTPISETELHYAEYDTLAGVECLDTLKNQLNKTMGSMPLTSTGILRERVQKAGKENDARKWFLKNKPTFRQYSKQVVMYHGGYVHGNRHHLNELIRGLIEGGDFASSYPYCLFMKYPKSSFVEIEPKSVDFILEHSKDYAFMFKLILVDVELKDDSIAMPFLQYSKTLYTINEICDNGRIIACDYAEIICNELDLSIIADQYEIGKSICTDVEAAEKDYLPRWFTDIVYDLFVAKTQLKDVDDVQYTVSKYMLNACYGLCCQRWDKPEIIEDEDGSYHEDESHEFVDLFETGKIKSMTCEELYEKHVKKRTTILPYVIGCYCTSYATVNLFKLGSMCETWLYSDTDSCYGLNWDKKKVEEYNNGCIEFIRSRGYNPDVLHEKTGKIYHLGVIEFEDKTTYTEFMYHGAKRYAGRCIKDGKIHITVAGVPKEKGAACLKDDLNNFRKDFVFEGSITGKLMHTHNYIDDIYINDFGDEVGDSIDLSECDYKLDSAVYHSLSEYINSSEEILIDIADDFDDLDLIV